MRHKQSEYMHWAKTQSHARFNLATSGVGAFPLGELGGLPPLEINGDNSYGYAPLKQAIAERYAVDADCVVTAAGTSGANYLAFATLLDAGDEVLVEHPAYGLLVDALEYVGAVVKRFARTPEGGYAVDPEAVRRAITPGAKLIVVNTPRTSFHLGAEFVVTSSLTKVYGVSGLRCGWILAEAELARAMWRMNDVFAATPVHPGELLSVAVFERLDAVRERFRRIVEADRKVLAEFLDRTAGVSAVRTEWGTTSFLRLAAADADEFLAKLRVERETSAVPGRFFGAPECFRVGMGVNHEMFAEGLRRIEEAL